jgi:signal transduction histidine kinase
MQRLGLNRHTFAVDVVIAIVALEAASEVALRHDALREPRTSAWFAAPAIALMILPLVGRRRFPFAAPAAVWLLAAAVSSVDGRLIVFTFAASIAGMVAAFLLGNQRDDLRARVGLAVVLGGATIVVYNDPHRVFGELVLMPLVFAIAWAAGFGLRQRAVRAETAERRALHAEQEGEVAAQLAVAEERARIARELHDIVAHAVSVMVLQVGAVRHQLLEAQEEHKHALQDVEHAGRTALADMRRLLDAMREHGDDVELAPQPGLDRLPALLQEVGRAGLPVQLQIDGDPFPLARGIDISAYRIVQEGLTNALKHAHASQAGVAVHYTPDRLGIEVRDNGVGVEKHNGHGYGLLGIHERVKLYGGEMTAADASDGGFLLTTSLPVRREDR